MKTRDDGAAARAGIAQMSKRAHEIATMERFIARERTYSAGTKRYGRPPRPDTAVPRGRVSDM
jgi:hypothetical protein